MRHGGEKDDSTHKIALRRRRSETGEYQRDVCEWLTCAHVLDVARHAHDQAPVRQAVNQLLAPAFVFRSWNSRRDLALLDCACALPSANDIRHEDGPHTHQRQRQRWRRVANAGVLLTEVGVGFRGGLAKDGGLLGW